MGPANLKETDILVIGSGIAGLSFALEVADQFQLVVITKKNSADSNTNYAQGGIAAVMDPDQDDFGAHIEDTLKAGAGLCHRDAVEMMIHLGPERIRALLNSGLAFSRQSEEGPLNLGREGGHSQNRIVHVKDFTGRAVEKSLLERCQEHPNIEIYEHEQAIDLVTDVHPARLELSAEITGGNWPVLPGTDKKITCLGAYSYNTQNDQINLFAARVVFLAGGGAGQAYLHTTNPAIATGDGVAMAYRAGCRVGNLEFFQFHPTSFYDPERPAGHRAFLISEAVRGHGAFLRLPDGRRFMDNYSEQMELAPRDIVARAIDAECKKEGIDFVYLDVTHFPPGEMKEHFPSIYAHCLEKGIDPVRDWIPVVPAAHYMCGGVCTDLRGRTDIANLYASGENSFTGVHGANRLASNSLLEGLVFSYQAARDILSRRPELMGPDRVDINQRIPDWKKPGFQAAEEPALLRHFGLEIRQIMQSCVGIVRGNFRLRRALRHIDLIYEDIQSYYHDRRVNSRILELRNLALVAQLIIRSALERKESRGLHYSVDYPKASPDTPRDTILRRRRV